MAVFIHRSSSAVSWLPLPAIRHHLIKQSYHYTFPFSIGSLYFGLRWQMEFAHLLNLNWRLYDLHLIFR